MKFLKLSTIEVRERQRETDAETIAQLKESIKTKGLLHAPVVSMDAGTPVLVCGMHRLTSISQLHEEAVPFRFNGEIVPPGEIPVVLLTDLGPADLLEAELEENIIRSQISWQDRARAIAAIHELRKSENPKQTFAQTAQAITEMSGDPNPPSGRARVAVRNAVLLAEAVAADPAVAKARNATEALGILYKRKEAALQAEILRRRSVSAPPPVNAILGDMTLVLPTLEPEQFDLIIADLPYGIGANAGGFRQRSVQHHNYDDSPDEALRLLSCVLTDGFRVSKSRANLFIFGDIDLFPEFKRRASAMGWKPFRTPVVWRKSNEGLAPWGREGPRRTYELIFFATKGQRGLHQSPPDVIDVARVGRTERDYGPQKPVELMKILVECGSMAGDYVLDPCCGAGATLHAARLLRRKALGIEIDEYAYNLATGKVVEEEEDDEEEELI